MDQRFGELEAEIERIDAKRHAYEADEIARGGVFVVLSHDGEARIERGFIRAKDEAPEPEETEDGEALDDEAAWIAGLKKQAMAESAEQLLAGTGWLPPLLRTERPAWLTGAQSEVPAESEDATEGENAESVADAAE